MRARNYSPRATLAAILAGWSASRKLRHFLGDLACAPLPLARLERSHEIDPLPAASRPYRKPRIEDAGINSWIQCRLIVVRQVVILPSNGERSARPPEELRPKSNGDRVIELRRANDGNLLAEIQEPHAPVRKWLNALPAKIPLETDWDCACAINRARPVDQHLSANEVQLCRLHFQRHRQNFCRVLERQRTRGKKCPGILQDQQEKFPILRCSL